MIIIWKGAGILVLLSAIGGFFAGKALFPETLEAGDPKFNLHMAGCCGIAMVINWIFFSLLFPGRGKILVDPATNEEVVMAGGHSLFFIPAKFFTFLFLLGGLGFAGYYYYITSSPERLEAYEVESQRAAEERELRELGYSPDGERLPENDAATSSRNQARQSAPAIYMVDNHLWTEARSGRQVRASLVRVESDRRTCVMRRADGTTFNVPMTRFVQKDQALIVKSMMSLEAR